MSQQQQQQVVRQQVSSQQTSSSVSMQQSRVQQQTQVQTRTVREVQQGVQRIQGPTQMMPVGLPAGASPPVFEQIFRNARFAQGGDAMFEGKVQGNPKPTVTWTRKGAQIVSGNKYQVTHDENTGVVTLNITAIGPGDEGEYTCTAANQYGEAICTVYIQPEAAYMMQQQRQSMQMQQSKSMMQQQQMSQTFSQQQQQMMSVQNGHMESFRVDTFEYRLLHEVEFRRSLTITVAGELEVDLGAIQGPPQAPQLQQKPRSTKVSDGGNATFTVNVNGYPTPRVIWFKNGVGLQQSDKYLMTQSAGQVTLVVKQVNSQDSGYYTMLAENSSGCTVASAQLAVVPRGEVTNGAPSPEVIRPERIEQQQAQQQMEVDVGEESGKSLEPKFVRGPADREVQEGKMVRFDARCSGRPYPEVTWYINGQLVVDDATHKVLVNEAGNHSLMISKASLSDAGVITCVAKNKSGEANFQCQLNVLEMQQMVAPKFVERFQQGAVAEGETVVLQCRAVGTPMPFLTWQKDGVSVENNPNVMVQSDQNGASTLQILSASGSDAGWYQCNAQNSAGSAATRARLHVQTTKPSGPAQPQRPHFPRPVKFIEPEPEPEPEVIMLRPVERAHHVPKAPEEEQPVEPPKFTHPLRDIDIVEGTRAHFEAKVTPVGDATMNVEWLIDGKPLAASSRATVTYRFGFVALDILNVIKADAGVYTCRATNAKGQAETSANLRITERPLIESQTQHPEALQQISYLEDQSRYQRTVSIEESSTIKPSFVKPLANLGEVMEGKYAHFEAQLHPVSDPFMRIEWFKDGKPITASSRINVIYNFGYVALNIMHLRPEDSGTYTVRATNKAGECQCQASIQVITLSSVTGDLGIPEQAQHIRSVEEMEAYRLQMQQRTAQEIAEATTAPVFKTELKDATAREGGYAHFEARLEPIGDPNLKVEWLKDGRPIEASSRITSFFNFGYVALTVKALIIKDAGTYTCVAKNSKGEAQVTAQLTVLSKTDTEVETQYQETVAKMQYLEDSTRYQKTETEETSAVTIPPKFLGPLKGTNKIVEGQKAHFEIRLEPQSDPTMTVEWYFNGQVIMSAAFAQKLGLGGIMVWSVDTDDFNGNCSQTGMRYPLLNAVKKALSSHTVMRPGSSINGSISEQLVPDGTVFKFEQETHIPDNTSVTEPELEGEPRGFSIEGILSEKTPEQEPHKVPDSISVSEPQFEEPHSVQDSVSISKTLEDAQGVSGIDSVSDVRPEESQGVPVDDTVTEMNPAEPHGVPIGFSELEVTPEGESHNVSVDGTVSEIKPEEAQADPVDGSKSEVNPEESHDVPVDGSTLEENHEEPPNAVNDARIPKTLDGQAPLDNDSVSDVKPEKSQGVPEDGIVSEMKPEEPHGVAVDGSGLEAVPEEPHNVSTDGSVFEIKPEEPHAVPNDSSVHDIKPEEPHVVPVNGSEHEIISEEPHVVPVNGSEHENISEEPHVPVNGSEHEITPEEPHGVPVDGNVSEIISKEPNVPVDGNVPETISEEPHVPVDGNVHEVIPEEPHDVPVDSNVHEVISEEPHIVSDNSSVSEMKPEEELQGFVFGEIPEEPHGTPVNPKALLPVGRTIPLEVINTESILNGTEEDLTQVMQTSVMPEMDEHSTMESMLEMETESSTTFMPEVEEHSSTTAMPGMPEHSTMTSIPDMEDMEENNTMIAVPEMEEKMTSTFASVDLDDLHNISPTPDINDLQSISIVPDLHDRKHMPSTPEKGVIHGVTTQKEMEVHSVTKPTFERGDKSLDTNTLEDPKEANKGRTNYRGARGGSGICIPAASAILVLLVAAMALC